ncbi:MAG TPA: GNAT family N-acetyltransferase [Anaerolineae bacterium]|nr:GNAT family N-acetyltransferase [Anaerolineae bacterium]
MDEQLIVRKATQADVPAILPLWEEMMRHHAERDERFATRSDASERFVGYLSSLLEDDQACCLVAENSDGAIIGYIIGTIKERAPIFVRTRQGYVSDICVTREHRQRGVGQQLFWQLRKWFRAQGVDHLEMLVAHHNLEGQAFWRAQGLTDYFDHMWMDLEDVE